jgi:hypothetical protein
MTTEEIKLLEKEVSKARFVLSQKASELHDLIEDRLPSSFEEIPTLADTTYKACQIWNELNNKLIDAKNKIV